MSEIFLCEQGQLANQSRREFKRAGIVVAEVADITRCQFIRASEILSADDLLWALLDALNLQGHIGSTGAAQREHLAANLLRIVNAKRSQ